MILQIILMIIGFALLVKGADFLVDGASSVAKKFHIPEIVIGLTIVSIGTSMPELIVSLKSSLVGHSDMAIGNVVGSNISNLFFILGICAIIKPLKFKKQTRMFENPFTFLATLALLILANNGSSPVITRAEGIILLVLCALFIIYNLYMAKNGEKFDKEEDNDGEDFEVKAMPAWKSILYIVIGIVALKFGGDFVVDSASAIAAALGMSETLISLTVIAFSTSLPELITSVTATIKGDTDMAIGNILGSQIFNIVLIIGACSTITPISYSIGYNKDLLLLLLGSILMALFPYIGVKNKMTRSNGIVYVIIYSMYLASLVLMNV